MERKTTTKNLVYSAIMVAFIVVMSQITIPTPSLVPFTLQTFAVAFCGYLLGAKLSVLVVGVYLLAGAIGLPFFAGFSGGLGVILNLTGGFIIGFIPLVVCCSLAKERAKLWQTYLLSFVGVIICHLIGVTAFSLISKNGFFESLLIASLPYLLKDLICVFFARYVSVKIDKKINLQKQTL